MKTITDNEIIICGHGGGKPSTKNLNSYSTLRNNQKAKNGKRKGIVEVRRHYSISDKQRSVYVKEYKTIIGRNIYSQPLRKYVYTKNPEDGKYYSDCSSSQMATLNRSGVETGGLLNTAGIHDSKKFVTVPVTIKNGHITNPWVLEVGDQILFRGNDPSRPLQIGHVEGVYKMPGTKCNVKRKAYIYVRKDQTAMHLTSVYTGDRIKIFEDCKDGWSLCSFGVYLGYIKNTNIDKVGKSSYLKGYTTCECEMRVKNSRVSKVITTVPVDTVINIVTMRKNWTYVKCKVDGVNLTGWIPTKCVSYK